MTRPPDIPAELWDALTPELRAVLAAVVARFEARIAALEERLAKTSANSSRPPSSDPPHRKPAPARAPSGKRRGGQPGHPKHTRPDPPPDDVVELKPAACTRCDGPLAGDDPDPLRHQVIELPPPPGPRVTEYRRHRLTCPRCGRVTCAALPPGVRGGYGPRVEAVCGLLSGGYRIGKRGVAKLMGDLFAVPIGPAAVCKLQAATAAALGPVAAEAHAFVVGKPANVDETGWREGGRRAWLWVAVTASVTVFLVRLSRGRKVLADLIPGHAGVLTTDRYPAYAHLPPDGRQVCWAHLRRDFQAMIDRADAGAAVGDDLLAHADLLLKHWKRVRDGTLTRRGFRNYYLKWIRAEVENLLGRGAACASAATAGTCRELLAVEGSLYTFAAAAGVEPTNNAAERALRPAVCWRKMSYGTDSACGSRFAERVLTAAASCRQQGRDVLGFLVDAVTAGRTGARPPSLVPAAG